MVCGLLLGAFLGVACTPDAGTDVSHGGDDCAFEPTCRSAGSEGGAFAYPVLIAGYAGESQVFCQCYDPVSSGWAGGSAPDWGGHASLGLVAVSCGEATKDLTSLPEYLVADASHQELWLMDYQAGATRENAVFTMRHLMSQVGVRILLADDRLAAIMPEDVTLHVSCTQAAVDYSQKQLLPLPTPEAVSLGTFRESGNFSGLWESSSLLTVIPQTFRAGETCLTFQVAGNSYTFLPDKDITLTPGRITYLNLGVAYDHITISIAEDGISVNGWGSGGDISGGDAG